LNGSRVDDYKRTLCKLSIADDAYIEAALATETANLAASGLDPKAHALVRLGALVALDTAPPPYMAAVEAARRAGASEEEVVGCLVAVMPALGAPRVVSAAPNVSLALGYDVTAALEDIDTASSG
jgi:4-carboxymuconolactone decarboxylase